jgi:hypothetical protein
MYSTVNWHKNKPLLCEEGAFITIIYNGEHAALMVGKEMHTEF